MKQSLNNKTAIKRITLVTDAWTPQINGVVTTLTTLVAQLKLHGFVIDVIQPQDYPNFPMPGYNEIRLVWKCKGIRARIQKFNPDAIHIATEGPLGWTVRNYALKNRIPFTSGYHTRYPEYIRARWPIPTSWSYALFRYFHKPAQTTLVPGEGIKHDLQKQNFKHLSVMSRGVDTTIFNPTQKKAFIFDRPLEKPIMLSVGRVAPEKNLRAFLKIKRAGTKIVVGSGPELELLKIQFPEVVFVGAKQKQELAAFYAIADVFVFPSKTDTFGVVNIEAIACGTPVAAYPVTGPKDIITEGLNGSLSDTLETAIEEALKIDHSKIHTSIPEYTWEHASKQFLRMLSPINKNFI